MSRVLLIEGTGHDAKALATQLRKRGHQVTEVFGREQLGEKLAALHKLEGGSGLPDLIISEVDAEEAGGPGLDLVLDAHGLRGGTPVILLASAADVDMLREAEFLEAQYVFFSPAEVDAVCRVTETFGQEAAS